MTALAPEAAASSVASRAEHAAWPRAVMATLLLLIATITVHLVDVTWFRGDASGSAVAQATVSDGR
jgi:hypothetical protein